MDEKADNIFSNIPAVLPDEMSQLLAHNKNMRIELIISHGHQSDKGFWYDQDQHEWVILISGAARLQFADIEEELLLAPGDHLVIPAHRKHRVSWTCPDENSVWLAIFSSQPFNI